MLQSLSRRLLRDSSALHQLSITLHGLSATVLTISLSATAAGVARPSGTLCAAATSLTRLISSSSSSNIVFGKVQHQLAGSRVTGGALPVAAKAAACAASHCWPVSAGSARRCLAHLVPKFRGGKIKPYRCARNRAVLLAALFRCTARWFGVPKSQVHSMSLSPCRLIRLHCRYIAK